MVRSGRSSFFVIKHQLPGPASSDIKQLFLKKAIAAPLIATKYGEMSDKEAPFVPYQMWRKKGVFLQTSCKNAGERSGSK